MTTVTLNARDVRDAVPMTEAIEAVRCAFLDLHAGEFELPARTALRDGQFLVMATHHRATASAMIKTMSLNFDRDPTIAGVVVWNETRRLDRLVADAGAITTLRTGAVVGVATDLLADPDAGRMTLIGAGAQAPNQIRAVHAVRPLEQLTVVARDVEHARALIATMEGELTGTELCVARDVESALRDAEIVCCATNATRPLFRESVLPSQVHVNAIGSFRPTMFELPDELLTSSDVVVDEMDAVLEESGEIIQALASGTITRDALTELGAALTTPTDHGSRTVFKTVGVAVQDWAIANLLVQKFLP